MTTATATRVGPADFAGEPAMHDGWYGQFRVHDGKYLLHDAGCGRIYAYRLGSGGVMYPGCRPYRRGQPRRAGYLSWFGGTIDRNADGTPSIQGNINGGTIYKVYVSRQHRRKGLATAMLGFAREAHPELEIRHSHALSPDGAGWAEARP